MSENTDQEQILIRNLAGPLPLEPRASVVIAAAEPDDVPATVPDDVPATEADDAPAAATPAVPKPAVPKPAAPKPGAPRPGAVHAPASAPAVVPVASTEAPLDPAVVTAAAQFGRVDGDGTVYVTDGDGERVVGQFPDVPAPEAMLLYIRRYLDLEAQVSLFEARLPQLSGRDLDSNVASLTAALQEPAAVGDLAGLRARLAGLTARATERKQALAAERAAARAEALAERTAIVERAEELAALDPARVQWKAQGQQMHDLLDTWKNAQRSGVRIDRGDEESLWKRFAKARGTFDRNRRSHFAELDSEHKAAKTAKEALIARAEALQTSTDWGATSAAYRGLMDEWKHAGRASRKEDDALWARFRAAQDVFFAARGAENAQIDADYAANLEVKNAILVEAEALLPVTDLRTAKIALRTLQDRWDAAGKVPRDAMQRTEARMRAVEQAVRSSEDGQWHSSDPGKRARAEGFASQLEASIERLEGDLAKAQAGGNQRKIADATAALEAQRAFLAQAMRAAHDAR